MEFKKIVLEVRRVYGKELIYPRNEAARVFCALIGNKVLKLEQVELIKTLGFEVELISVRSLAELKLKTKES